MWVIKQPDNPSIPSAYIILHVYHEKMNQCLTNINQCLTDIENQFYKVSLTLTKYQFVTVISVKYQFTQISTF